MKHARLPRCAAGFTLIESIVVLIVLSIAALGVASLSSGIFDAQDDNKTLQTGAQLLQGCAEQVLAIRREQGYAASLSCGFNSMPSGFAAPTVESATYTGAGCPTAVAGTQCKLVTIKVATSGGDELRPLKLVLVGP